MFSTIHGATKCAKELRQIFKNSGIIMPLHRCQAALAIAASFRDWHELESLLALNEKQVDPAIFRRRLLANLPVPCRSPALAWLDREPHDTSLQLGHPSRWHRDVFPYLLANVAAHRGTALLRPGSGTGQKLREKMVIGLLLNVNGGDWRAPLLEPESLAMVLDGPIDVVFADEVGEARFETELATLTRAGVLQVTDTGVRVLPPDRAEVARRVSDLRDGKLESWGDQGGAEGLDLLSDMLASIGIDGAREIAKEIMSPTQGVWTTPSGPILTLLTDLATAGQAETFARAFCIFGILRPQNAGFVKESVPAKISSGLFSKNLGLDTSKVLSWATKNPDWPDQLKGAIDRPPVFAELVDQMSFAIATA
tara:strand:- start:38 stop:1138 length:1101 start_codon:yes stop_codon:yes gene_type:complete